MWNEIKRNVTLVEVELGGKKVQIEVPNNKINEVKTLISTMNDDLLLIHEFDSEYKKSFAEIEKSEKKEENLKKQIKELAEKRKALKDDSIANRDGFMELRSKVSEVMKENKNMFLGTTLEDLGVDIKLPSISNRTKGSSGSAKYDDAYLREWSELKRNDSRITWVKLLEIVNEKYNGKRDLKGGLINFKNVNTLRSVLESWEVRNGIRQRKTRTSKQG